jgi:hypothetical protein
MFGSQLRVECCYYDPGLLYVAIKETGLEGIIYSYNLSWQRCSTEHFITDYSHTATEFTYTLYYDINRRNYTGLYFTSFDDAGDEVCCIYSRHFSKVFLFAQFSFILQKPFRYSFISHYVQVVYSISFLFIPCSLRWLYFQFFPNIFILIWSRLAIPVIGREGK